MPYSSIYSYFPTETERQTLKEGVLFQITKKVSILINKDVFYTD